MKLGYTVYWVNNAEETATFYETVFGLTRQLEMQTPLTPWIEMSTGETTLAFAEFSEADVLFSNNYRKHEIGEPVVASIISFITDKVEETYHAALANGGVSITAPRQEPWGQIIARVRDINGIAISIASPFNHS